MESRQRIIFSFCHFLCPSSFAQWSCQNFDRYGVCGLPVRACSLAKKWLARSYGHWRHLITQFTSIPSVFVLKLNWRKNRTAGTQPQTTALAFSLKHWHILNIAAYWLLISHQIWNSWLNEALRHIKKIFGASAGGKHFTWMDSKFDPMLCDLETQFINISWHTECFTKAQILRNKIRAPPWFRYQNSAKFRAGSARRSLLAARARWYYYTHSQKGRPHSCERAGGIYINFAARSSPLTWLQRLPTSGPSRSSRRRWCLH